MHDRNRQALKSAFSDIICICLTSFVNNILTSQPRHDLWKGRANGGHQAVRRDFNEAAACLETYSTANVRLDTRDDAFRSRS